MPKNPNLPASPTRDLIRELKREFPKATKSQILAIFLERTREKEPDGTFTHKDVVKEAADQLFEETWRKIVH